eukprot:TRINITY_DN12004_c0_g1_i2.p2 TRINITY_DN12004_c0_g1~~TRINITY_DN12004_c0_g1_i2.p2  ORF type:complete len:119 (-),score=33.09 TRINITY_DN12004_c0_g1_i2:51-407(-)
MIRRPPRSTLSSSSAASDVYKRQVLWHRDISVAIFPERWFNLRIRRRRCTTLCLRLLYILLIHVRAGGLELLAEVGLVRVLKLSLIHISEPTRLLSISYAVFCLKKKKKNISQTTYTM